MPEQDVNDDGNKVVKGCLLALLLLGFLVVGSCLLIYKNKDALLDSASRGMENAVKGLENVIDMPYYGEQEYILTQHGTFINQLKATAQGNTSLFSFAAAVEKMPKPDALVYFGIVKGKDTTEVIRKIEWSGRSTVVMNGYGAGRFNADGKQFNIMIYENSGPWAYMDEFKAYFLHDVGEPVPDTDSLSY